MQNRAKQIFDTGKIYSNSAKILNSADDPRQILPSQVIAALTLELYFKCIYYLETGQDFKINNKQSHDFLLYLTNFNNLPKIILQLNMIY